ncbi:MAG TPA: DUF1667 domain-containing protein [Clostridia bacterium]|nr:DUF1667 domain-containing protein [Clostridia bacterium]
MEEKELICINCPMGCRLKALVEEGKVVSVTGFTCKRGETYAHEELTRPVRMVTALVRIEGREQPLPVKTDRPIEKGLIFEALAALRNVTVSPPVKTGDVVLANVCGTPVSFIATASV